MTASLSHKNAMKKFQISEIVFTVTENKDENADYFD
jgi:hypothetical protein